MDVNDLISEIAQGNNNLGGGAITPLSGAIGVALGHRVLVNLPASKQAEHEDMIEELKIELLGYSKMFQQLIQDDQDVMAYFSEALALPKTTEAEKVERTQTLQKALVRATEAPLHTMALAVEAMQIFAEFASLVSSSTAADFEIGMNHLETVLISANVNVQENLDMIKDDELASQFDQRAEELIGDAEEAMKALEE